MKKQIILVISLVVAGVSFGQGKPTIKKEQGQKQEQSKEQPILSIPKAKGPTSFGSLKIGMTKEAIDALQISDGMYLVSPMTAYASKYYTPKEGIDKFDAALSLQFSGKPLEVVLTFEAGSLTEMYFSLSESMTDFERVTAQISEKYGPGIVNDSRKEEQCIYKNGANFKISSGTISTTWSENISATERIETRTSNMSVDSCPSNLRYGSVGGIQMRTMSIRKLANTPGKKPENLF